MASAPRAIWKVPGWKAKRTEGSASSQADDLVVVLGGVRADRAQVHPAGDLTRAEVRASGSRRARGGPGSCGPGPNQSTKLRLLGCVGVEPHEVGVDAFVLRAPPAWCGRSGRCRRGPRCAVERPRRENPTAALAAFPPASTVTAYSKGTLPPKGRSIQCPWSSSQIADVRVGQPDEDVGGRVAHAEHVEVRHGELWRTSRAPDRAFGHHAAHWGHPGAPLSRRTPRGPVSGLLASRRRRLASCSASMSLWRRLEGLGLARRRSPGCCPCGSRGRCPRR